MDWLKENWFKLALVLVVPITAGVLVYGFVIYPENIKQQERIASERQSALEKSELEVKESKRVEDLKSCLSESESQETYAHLSYCGQDKRSPNWCYDVFGGAENVFDVMGKFTEFASKEYPTLESAYDACNCSLEGWIREGFEEDKKERDQLCYALHGS